MNTTIRTARRFGATLAIAGIAAFGSVAVAPAASAAQPVTVQDGPDKVIDRSGDHGPDAFIELEHGRVPVFFCEVGDSKDDKGKAKDEKDEKAEKADQKDEKGKHHNNCQTVTVDGGRF
jgi:hypothetical protein